ncbi:uncharacterized protein LOC21402904 [Morus notabilis]|uniref:uncharacterized protein LOC21402904 n=1 Tax=Morus notabilis TaxID=981085 RepID=UPI000CED4859|nr:uncharacterized protein LOC21402904 [Morus notabilis]XP_024020281.1 uncharacterized protein LOC21402904 [Morus notabilis]
MWFCWRLRIDNSMRRRLSQKKASSVKWMTKFVKSSMPQNFFAFYNEKKETPKAIFIDSHEKLIKEGTEWLSKTSKSCSVVAALVATVAFTTSSAFPSEVKEEKGTPMLEDEPTFNTFAIASSMLSASDQ